MPTIGGTGQLFSQCAYQWAVAGCRLYLAPYGSVTMTGVTGNLITFQNVDIANGQVIQAGTLMVMGPPVSASASASQPQLDRLRGFLNGFDSFLTGTANQLLRWNAVGGNVFLQPVNGFIFSPNPSATTEISPKDVGGAGITTTPIPTPGTGLSAYYDMPNLPESNLLPAVFYALVHIRLSAVTAENSEATSFKASQAGTELAALNSVYSIHTEVLIPVTGNKFQLDYLKVASRVGCYARVRVIGYYF